MRQRQQLSLREGNILVQILREFIFFPATLEHGNYTGHFSQHITGSLKRDLPGGVGIVHTVLFAQVFPNPPFFLDLIKQLNRRLIQISAFHLDIERRFLRVDFSHDIS